MSDTLTGVSRVVKHAPEHEGLNPIGMGLHGRCRENGRGNVLTSTDYRPVHMLVQA